MTNSDLPPITATVTMCRRPHLMVRTMDSLLRCMQDSDHICRWIAMDDGSTSADLYRLAKAYPFLEICCNDLKGHPAALNSLFSMVETDHIFHFEDDWEFMTPGNLLHKCWSVLQAEKNIGVACLRGFNFGSKPTTDPDVTYGIHAYKPPGSPYPGFSLNPGLMDLRTVRAVGPFEDTPEFEMKYALRYHNRGFRLAHLNPEKGRVWIRHTGSDSAYNLNRTHR